jgi:glycyl-tRNA synthetase beta chain
MSELLFEAFSEEIPARMQTQTAESLLWAVQQAIKAIMPGANPVGEWFVTPRRIGFVIYDLPKTKVKVEEEVRGPKTSAPHAALEGFLKKYNIANEKALEIRDGYYFYEMKQEKSAIDAIREVIEQELVKLTWPKSMRWGDYNIKWVRPLHSILCLFGGAVVPVTFGHIEATNVTYGHRFLSPRAIKVKDFADYRTKLQEAHVILQGRKELIMNQVTELLRHEGISAQLVKDDELLEEVAGLVEYPVVMLGKIEQRFMTLPEEVLITTIRHHQKYLMLREPNGALAPYFIIVANIKAADGGKQIIHGNQKVLRARLCDAEFFFNTDRATKLADRVEKLAKVAFHDKIGSMLEKVQGVSNLASKLAKLVEADPRKVTRACELAKADLVTEMVSELPELQGIMGYHYALLDGEDPEVALAIKEHYQPQGASDSTPTSKIGAVIALADKLYTMNQMFAIGIKPTGSKDPFALRRAALGILRIIQDHKLGLDLADKELGLRQDVLNFIAERSR